MKHDHRSAGSSFASPRFLRSATHPTTRESITQAATARTSTAEGSTAWFKFVCALAVVPMVVLSACGGGGNVDVGGGGSGGGGGGSGSGMDLVQASNGFGQLLPHTALKLDAQGQPTTIVVPIRSHNDLVQNVTLLNPVLPSPQFPTNAILPSNLPGNQFFYAEFTQNLDVASVLDSSPTAQANSGLTGAITLVALDPSTGTTLPVKARVFIDGFTFSGLPIVDPITGALVLPKQHWVSRSSTSSGNVALDVDGETPGLGFPGTEGSFGGDQKLISPKTVVLIADTDGDLSTYETFPTNRQIKLRISTAVKSTSGRFLTRQALASTTVGVDNLLPSVSTSPPPNNTAVIAPGQGDTDVDPLTSVRIEFSEPIQPTSLGSIDNGQPPLSSAAASIKFGPLASAITVPFSVRPVSVFDLSTYELIPAFSLPGEGPANFQCAVFNRVDVTINASQFRDLTGNINLFGASTFFFTGEGPGLVNAPISPDTIYVSRSGPNPAVSVIDLNGFGGGTGNPTFDPTYQTFTEGGTNYPNNPNLRLQGSLMRPALSPGNCTINGGSSGVFTLTRDSSLNDLLVRAPLITSAGDMMIGHALDSAFNNGPAPFGCQSGGGNLCAFDGKKVINPVINGNSMQPFSVASGTTSNQTIGFGAENLVVWAPHPNPPPLIFPPLCVSPYINGQEPSSIDNAPNLTGTTPTAGLTNLLAPGDPFGQPTQGVPPAGLLSPEQNAFFEGPSLPQPLIGACQNYSVRQQIGHYLYVIDRGRREVVVLNSNRMTVIDRIPTQDPTTFAMSPNLNLLAVVNQLGNLVSFIDIDPSSATFHEIVQETVVGLRPRGIAWDPGNEDVLVCNELESTVSIISAAQLTVRKVVSSQLNLPFDVAITPRQFGFGYQRYVYYAYILNRNGRVAVFESGPDTVNGWGYDDIIGNPSYTFRSPKAIQPDHTDLRSAVWIAHEGPINIANGQPGPFGVGAVSKLAIESGFSGVIALGGGGGGTPQFRDIFLGVSVSISNPDLSGVPVDIAFDDQRNLCGLRNTTTAYSAGSGLNLNGKQLVRTDPVTNAITNANEPRYMFVAVPNPTQGIGVVDVIRIDQSFRRVDTNAFQAGIQSIPVTDVQVVADYFRQ